MSKLTITEAVRVIPVSESKLRRDMKAGVVSFEVDEKGKKHFDPSELARMYGEIALPENNGQVKENNQQPSETGHDSKEIIALLEQQNADLKAQLDTATAEKEKLLQLTDRLTLMLPAPKPEETEIKPRGWLQRLIGV
jgi:hypothetical protein